MNYDDWKTSPPDDDPEGEQQHDDRCPSCGASADDDCDPDCLCRLCERKRAQGAA